MSGAPTPEVQRPSQTKIVATIGPASDGEEQLAELIRAGVDVFRINAAHGNRPEHERRLAACRAASESVGWPVAVLVDLAGPKMRLGELAGGQLDLAAGDRLRFVRGDQPGRPGELTSTYELLIDELAAGDRIMLADGTVSLVVEQVGADEAVCRVVQPGTVRSRQGVNLPGVQLSAPALGEADRDNAVWAARSGVDFLGLSFVRDPAEVHQLKALIEDEGGQTQVIAKIEKPEALDRLEEIVEAADAIMVARGDLGVEIDIAQMAVAQKRIVALCNQRRKPVIIATQMLDSMTHARIPTRAEATDVANAILDGADACMLSGETAIGEHPVEVVRMMNRIAVATEPIFRDRAPDREPDLAASPVDAITEATVYSASRIAARLGAKLVIVASSKGETARALSKNRSFVPAIGVSDSETTLRRMCLYWGVFPVRNAPTGDTTGLLEYVISRTQQISRVGTGDRVVLVTGTRLLDKGHNVIVVHEVE
ncbi:MAG: pyruvate kinase [Pirellulaceae bacterium]|jgi:pyruvate kinase|nr:pyruvate kinase [Thermoguttaceae bacterium]NLZ02187.1 pyruvate kinase [Pirellulaceae bacterium]